ncbi:MAG: ATP-binding region ATPase domain protein [Gemmatimonadales bacterium]|nr:ATP-binding region ATPase domain protein [Gemmatimonadales bacterium]
MTGDRIARSDIACHHTQGELYLRLSLPGAAQRRLLALVPVVLVVLIGALTYERSRLVVGDVREVERSHETLEASAAVLTRAIDAETGQRAYLLTGDSTFLDPYRGARADIAGSLATLRSLASDNPSQLSRLSTIEQLVNERFVLLDSSIAPVPAGRLNSARNSPAQLRGKEKMDQLRAAVGALQAQERIMLTERRAAEQRGVTTATILILAAALAAVLLSSLINMAISRALDDQDKANVELRRVNEDLERQSEQLEMQAVEMESQAAELEATGEDLRSTNDELSRTTHAAEKSRDAAEHARLQLEQVLENLPDAASVFDSEWRWTYVNAPAKRILASLGVDPETVKGRVLWETIPQIKGTRFESETARAKREGVVVEYEDYLPELDAWLDNTIVPVEGTVMTFSRDVTRRKREEQGAKLLSDASRVLQSTLDYEKTLDAVARLAVGDMSDWCAVDLVDSEGAIRQVVVAHVDEARIRWARELNRRYPPDYAGPTGVGHVIKTGQPEVYPDITDEMLVASARDEEHLGLMRELRFRSALIVPMNARGRTLGALTLVSTDSGRRYGDQDVALAMEVATRAAVAIDNAQLYQGALAASEAKSAFLATMSHELRTPLNAIIGYQSLLKEGIDGPLNRSQIAHLNRIRASADHLLSLIDEVLTFSRVDAGKEEVHREDVSLRSILNEALTMIAPLAEAKGLSLRAEGDERELFTDARKVRQILLNLLSNAIKFTDRGEIVIRSRSDGENVEVSVVDTGIGIADENLERIFDPFWQVEQRSTRKVGGTGLGLSVSRTLARLVGGDIQVESEPGKGSTFTLTLPARPA